MRAWTRIAMLVGTVAVASSIALATLDIIFAVVLSQSSSPELMSVSAIVASTVGTVAAISCMGLLIQQILYQAIAHMYEPRNRRECTYALAGVTAVFSVLSDVASAIMLGIMKTRTSDTPPRMILLSTETVIDGGLTVWAISVLSQGIFVTSVVVTQRRVPRERAQPYRLPSIPQAQSQMEKDCRLSADSKYGNLEVSTMDTESSSSSQRKPRSGSDAMASFRSSWTNDRSMTSQTKLIYSKSPYRSASLDDISKPAEDGFDSWDTSAVDLDAREAVEMASPAHLKLLETIPASPPTSPPTSRSVSPGYHLDLEPSEQRKKARECSPPSPSKIESTGEAHIHPLFRSASTDPFPTISRGTMVTAAPGAGFVISDHTSLRLVQRKWRASWLSSPLKHSHSLDNVQWTIAYEDKMLDGGGERTVTPPIPDWIMTAGSRTSLAGYNSRRKSETGIGPEVIEDI